MTVDPIATPLFISLTQQMESFLQTFSVKDVFAAQNAREIALFGLSIIEAQAGQSAIYEFDSHPGMAGRSHHAINLRARMYQKGVSLGGMSSDILEESLRLVRQNLEQHDMAVTRPRAGIIAFEAVATGSTKAKNDEASPLDIFRNLRPTLDPGAPKPIQ